ncbi:MAG: fluoride efflux transporter CrcB [Bacteroidales bacterium]|nr:fluoride efflux transporter CrcB [Bacteroidales bacterium]
MLKTILLVGSGGFVGSVARYYVSKLNVTSGLFSLPVGTLLVNVTGSLLLGFLVGLAGRGTGLPPEWRLFLMVGLCGGFTTFSTFAGENLSLMQGGQYLSMAIYTALSVFLGLIAVFAGYSITKLI